MLSRVATRQNPCIFLDPRATATITALRASDFIKSHPPTASTSTNTNSTTDPSPNDTLYRARTKSGHYVRAESRGRLHPEPGGGRKAIVLRFWSVESGGAGGGASLLSVGKGVRDVLRREVSEFVVYVHPSGM